MTSNITVYPGWNMLALQPQFGGQTVSQALEVLNQKIQLGDCIIGFDRGFFTNIQLIKPSVRITKIDYFLIEI